MQTFSTDHGFLSNWQIFRLSGNRLDFYKAPDPTGFFTASRPTHLYFSLQTFPFLPLPFALRFFPYLRFFRSLAACKRLFAFGMARMEAFAFCILALLSLFPTRTPDRYI